MSRHPAFHDHPAPDDVLSWLIAGDPAVVWQAQCDLMALPVATWSKTRRRVAREGWGAELLRHRSSDGTWGGGWYSPKWTSTFYSLQLLAILGGGGHPDAVATGRLLLDRGVGDDGAVRLWVTQHPDTCVTGMLLQIACAVGLGADPACEAMAGSLLREQMDDGGWNCERRRGATHSSFDTTLSVLEGLSAWEAPAPLAPRVSAASDGGREFLLAHRLYRSHRTGEVVHPTLTLLVPVLVALRRASRDGPLPSHRSALGRPPRRRPRAGRGQARPRRHVAAPEPLLRTELVRDGASGTPKPVEHPAGPAGS